MDGKAGRLEPRLRWRSWSWLLPLLLPLPAESGPHGAKARVAARTAADPCLTEVRIGSWQKSLPIPFFLVGELAKRSKALEAELDKRDQQLEERPLPKFTFRGTHELVPDPLAPAIAKLLLKKNFKAEWGGLEMLNREAFLAEFTPWFNAKQFGHGAWDSTLRKYHRGSLREITAPSLHLAEIGRGTLPLKVGKDEEDPCLVAFGEACRLARAEIELRRKIVDSIQGCEASAADFDRLPEAWKDGLSELKQRMEKENAFSHYDRMMQWLGYQTLVDKFRKEKQWEDPWVPLGYAIKGGDKALVTDFYFYANPKKDRWTGWPDMRGRKDSLRLKVATMVRDGYRFDDESKPIVEKLLWGK